jgi:hypothetical protein
MKTRGYLTGTTVALVVTVLATLSLIACQSSQQQATSATPAATPTPTTEKVFIVFEGPWAFAPDPKDATSVVLIAPKTKGHTDLFVKASNESTLFSGVYDLSFPAHSGTAAGTVDPSIAQANIDPKNLQLALDKKSARYVVRLPKPEEYLVAARWKSRYGPKYPPDASTEKDYATAVSLRYNVASLNGFSLSGTLDSGTFDPFLLHVDTPMIRFVIMPAQLDDPHDKCHVHSRQSFHDLTTLLALTLYEDYPGDPDSCHKTDPQNSRPMKSAWNRGPDLQSASMIGGINVGGIGDYLAAAMYFFGLPIYDCTGLVVALNPTPATP